MTWGVTTVHPQEFLADLYRNDRVPVRLKLEQQAADRGRTLAQLLGILRKTVPEFVELFSRDRNP